MEQNRYSSHGDLPTGSGCSIDLFTVDAVVRFGNQSGSYGGALFNKACAILMTKSMCERSTALIKSRPIIRLARSVPQAELKSADAYYLNEQFPEAINLFKEFQSLHPTSEHNAFVTLRLGQAYFDQFTTVDRDQKNTELAKGYFETVITNYPKSPQAAIAQEKLAQALGYLAKHEFTAAQFYFQEQKYPAARDRFEEIVRKYRDTPTAVKSLYFLGESYRLEKNWPARGARLRSAYSALSAE